MCGFFSIHNQKENIFEPYKLSEKINKILVKRGPDFSDSFSFDSNLKRTNDFSKIKCMMSASRLNIIDNNEKSNLPLFSKCKKYVLFFNGEIYNFKNLANKYLKNIQLTTNSDTEVLLYLLIQEGEKILEELNGIFAFVFYNLSAKKIVLVKDKFGTKPLYYIFNENLFSFSSDAKCLFEIPNFSKKINKELSLLYLSGMLDEHISQTMIKDIFKLEPASYIVYDMSNHIFIKKKKYWVPSNKISNIIRSKKELYNDLISVLESQTNIDRKFAFTLSGGLDSSIIACLLREIYPEKELNSYTLNFEEKSSLNEKRFSNIVVKKYRLKDHNISIPMNTYFEDISEVSYSSSFPVYGFSNIAQNQIYKKIHNDGFRIVIDGQGADEVFGGYQGFGGALMYKNLKNLNLAAFIQNIIYSMKNSNINNRIYLNFLSRFLNKHIHFNLLKYTSKKIPFNFLKNLTSNNKDLFKMIDDKNFSKSDYFHNDILFFLSNGIQGLLKSLDSNSMSNSIEARVPYLDDKIIEKYAYLDSSLKVNNKLVFKNFLRDTFKKNLPQEISGRKDKIGFAVDDNIILNNNIEKIKSSIRNVDENSFVNTNELLNYLDNSKHINSLNSPNILRLYSFLIWSNQFKVYE
jgi:asparagine synthase (glutamine-hydrolysing)